MPNGIDVSANNGGIDFVRAKASGQVDWVHAKASEGVTITDDHFALYHDACKNAGIPFGAYHFLHFNAIDDPKSQAGNFLAAIDGREGELLPMVDVEVTDNQTIATITEILGGFLAEVEKTLGGKRMLLYTFYSFWKNTMVSTDAFSGHPLWIAEYNSDNAPTLPGGFPSWTVWQWSSSGSVNGVGTSVDLDRLNGDSLALISR
jgi:lysozyme